MQFVRAILCAFALVLAASFSVDGAPSPAPVNQETYSIARGLPAELSLRLKPLERPGQYIGGCFPGRNTNQGGRNWGRATQGTAWDPFDNVYYTLGARKDGAEFMRIMAWGDSETERVFIDETKWEFGRFPHQGLALYRPSKSAPVRFFAQANVFEGKDQRNPANAFNLNLLEWRRESRNMTKLATWQLFDPAVSSNCAMNVCISQDGRIIVCRSRRLADKVWFFGVWKTAKLLKALKESRARGNKGPIDARHLCERIFDSPWGTRNIALQSLATDGQLLYALNSPADMKPHQIFVMDLEGRKVLERRPSFEGFEIAPEFNKRCVEGEGLFFAKVGKKLRLVMDVSLSVYDKPDENGMPNPKWTRYNHYYVLF